MGYRNESGINRTRWLRLCRADYTVATEALFLAEEAETQNAGERPARLG